MTNGPCAASAIRMRINTGLEERFHLKDAEDEEKHLYPGVDDQIIIFSEESRRRATAVDVIQARSLNGSNINETGRLHNAI